MIPGLFFLLCASIITCCIINPESCFGRGPDEKKEEGEEEWLAEFYEPRPIVPLLWTWLMISNMTAIHTYWVYRYTSKDVLKTGDIDTVWVFLGIQFLGIAFSNFACNFWFPRMPVILGLPFILIGFTPPFL